MDYFLIFRHHCLEEPNQGRQLDILQVELFNLNQQLGGSSFKHIYNTLTFGLNFRQCILAITKRINELSLSFTNVQLVSEDTQLFTSILPQEFNIRKLSMPYVLTNFVDWRSLLKEKYGCVGQSLSDIAKFLSLVQQHDEGVIMKILLKKFRAQKNLEDTDTIFFKQHHSKGLPADFSYFRCIGLPFQISKNELVQQLIEPERYNIKTYGLSLIFEHGKFSGKAVIKVPAEYCEMILKKDRMYIGKRYVELVQINQEQFESYKFREERQREESRFREPRPYDHERSRRKDSRSDQDSHSRSRSNSRSPTPEKAMEIHNLLNEAAIKIRGLPYSLNNWDIEQIFKRFNFVRGSIKMGFMGDRKSGQAVVLFPNKGEAERAMCLQGITIQNRYLELRIINKDNYDHFK